MGFIGKIFGAIFGLIGTLFGAFGKVLGLGNKSDYYVEVDSSKGAEPAPSVAPVAAAAVATSPVAQAAAPESVKPAASAPAPAPTAVAASPVKQNGKAVENGKAAENVTFAPDRLLTLSSTGGRRRPGPSLSPFKDMARQVQRPTNA